MATSKVTPKVTSHQDFVVDRQKKIDLMFKKLEADPALRKQFHTNPEKIANDFKVKLSDEEIFISKSLKGSALVNIWNRFRGNPLAMFDNNCGCGGGGGGTSSW